MIMTHFDTKAPMILDTLWFETIAPQDTWHLAENVIIDTSFEKLHPTDILQHIFYVLLFLGGGRVFSGMF